MAVHPYCLRFSIQTNTTFGTPPFEHCAIKCLIKIVLGGGRILVLFNGWGTEVEFIHMFLHYFLLWLQCFPLISGRISTQLRHIHHRPLTAYKSTRIRKDIQQQRRRILLQTKRQSAVQSPQEDSFPVSNRQSSKIVNAYVWHTKKRINEQCDSIRCAKKQENGAHHEP